MTDSPSGSNPQGVVDWEVALETVDGDRELLGVVLEAMLEEVPEMLDQLSKALESGDAEVAHRCAHTIKGSARTVMAVRTIESAAAVEALANANDLEAARKQLPELERAIRELSAECARFMD